MPHNRATQAVRSSRWASYRRVVNSGSGSELAPVIAYAGTPYSWWAYVTITPDTPTNAGGSITSYSVIAGSLPAGISLNASTGQLTGAPTNDVYGTGQSVTIRATGPGGTDDEVLTISVLNPTSITGCLCWLDLNKLSTLFQDSAKTTPVASDGDVIGAVADRTVNGNDFTQATSSRKPTYQTAEINSIPVAEFDGTDDGLDGMNAPVTAFTVFRVSRALAGYSTNRTDLTINNPNARVRLQASNYEWYQSETGTKPTFGSSLTTESVVCIKVVSTASVVIYVNGTQAQSFDPNDGVLAGAAMAIGYVPSTGAKCQYGEFIVYSGALSDADRGSVEDYLGAKWGITVA